MKKILLLIVCIICLPAFAQSNLGQTQKNGFAEHFSFDEKIDDFKFNYLPKYKIKYLSKSQKQEYKKYLKIEKYLRRNNVYKAQRIDYYCLPVYWKEYKRLYSQKKYEDALKIFKRVIEINNSVEYFTKESLDSDLSNLYFINNYNQEYIDTIKPYLHKKEYQNDFTYVRLAFAYNELGNYSISNSYAKKVENKNDYKETSCFIQYNNYVSLKNNEQARYYAIKLAGLKPCPENYLRVIAVANSKSEKLKYNYLLADEYYKNQDYQKCAATSIYGITPIEDEKIINASKTIKGFAEIPLFKDIYEKDYSYMKIHDVYQRQKNFHKSTNNCIKKYNGNSLKACLASINSEQKELSYRFIEKKQEEMRMIAEQQRLNEMHIMNYNLMQQNYNLQNINYQLSRPRYTNTTVTPIGNTYYMNSYSY